MYIRLRWRDGRTWDIRFADWMTVRVIKHLSELKTSIPAPLQELSHKGAILTDEAKLTQSEAEVSIALDRTSSFPLLFRVCPVSEEPFYVPMQIQHKVSHLKARIAEVMNVEPQQQRLMLGWKQWFGHQNISDVFVPGKLVLELLRPTDLIVHLTLGPTQYQVPAAGEDTIARVKQRFERVAASDLSEVASTHGGTRLEDSTLARTVGRDPYLAVSEAAETFVWMKAIGKKPLRVRSAVSRQKLGNSVELMRRGETLHPGQSLRSESVVEYGAMFLTCRTSTMETATFAVFPEITVATLKQAVTSRLRIPAAGLTLVSEGQRLEDGASLSAYAFQHHVVVDALQPFDNFIWLEVADYCFKVDVPDFNWPLSRVLSSLQMNENLDFVVANRTLVDVSQPLVDCSLFPGSVLQLHYNGLQCSEDTRRDATILPSYEGKTSMKCLELTELVTQASYLYTFRYKEQSATIAFPEGVLLEYVKQRVRAKFSISGQISLTREGKVLEDSMSKDPGSSPIYVFRPAEFYVYLKFMRSRRCVSLPTSDAAVATLKSESERMVAPPFLLFFREAPLDERRSLSDYSVTVASRINVVHASAFISVLTLPSLHSPPDKSAFLRHSDKTVHLLRFHRADDSRTFISGVAALFGLTQFVLVHNNTIIGSLRSAGVKKGAVVEMWLETDEAVTVIRSDLSVVCRPLSRTATIREVKAASSVHPSSHLFVGETALAESATLSKCGVTPCTVLRTSSASDSVIKVKRPGKDSLRLFFANCTHVRVGELVRRLEVALLSCHLRVYVNGCLSQDLNSIAEESDMLALTPSDVVVEGFSLQAVKATVYLPDSALVSDLKAAFAKQFKRTSIRLTYEGVELQDDSRSLSQCGFNKQCRLSVLLQEDELMTIATAQNQWKVGFSKKDTDSSAKIVQMRAQKLLGAESAKLISSERAANIENYLVARLPEQCVRLHSRTGEAFSVVVPISDVSSLSSHVASRLGLSVDSFSLSWVGQVVDKFTAADYHLEQDSVILCTRGSDATYHIRVPHKPRPIKVRTQTNITDLKLKFHEKKLKSEIRLISEGRVMQDNSILRDYPGNEFAGIEIVQSEDAIATITSPTGETFAIPVSQGTSLLQLKDNVENFVGIPHEHQRLYLGEEQLQDAYQFEGTGKDVELRLDTLQELLVLERVDGTKTPLLVSLTSPVALAKTQIAVLTGLSSTEQRLYCNDVLLEESKTLNSQGVVSGATLMLLCAEDIRLFVKSLFSVCSVYVRETDCIRDIRNKVSYKLGMCSAAISLVAKVELKHGMKLSTIESQTSVLDLNIEVFPKTDLVVFVNNPPRLPAPFRVSPQETIAQLIGKAEKSINKKVTGLKHHGKVLDITSNIASSSLKMFSTTSLDP